MISGIMAILFCGIVMSQYAHYNLSPVTQITMQQTMRTLAFACESCIFAYLGMAIFSFPHQFEVRILCFESSFNPLRFSLKRETDTKLTKFKS